MSRRGITTLALALGLHGSVLALGRALPERWLGLGVTAHTAEVEVDVVPLSPREERVVSADDVAPPPSVVVPAARELRVASRTHPLPGSGGRGEGAPAGSAAEPGGAAPPGAGEAAAPAGSGAAPRPPVDLGLGGDIAWMYRGARAERPKKRKQSVGALNEGLEARDRARGLARGGVVASAAHSAALAHGPPRGRATFVVQTDAGGRVRSVRTAGVNGDRALWQRVAKALLAALGAKRLRVPPGARGLRVTVLVEAKVQMPSGRDSSKGNVQMQGAGAQFDVADIGAVARRLISSRIVGEEVL